MGPRAGPGGPRQRTGSRPPASSRKHARPVRPEWGRRPRRQTHQHPPSQSRAQAGDDWETTGRVAQDMIGKAAKPVFRHRRPGSSQRSGLRRFTDAWCTAVVLCPNGRPKDPGWSGRRIRLRSTASRRGPRKCSSEPSEIAQPTDATRPSLLTSVGSQAINFY